jgi:Protein of unknown function (DUF551)
MTEWISVKEQLPKKRGQYLCWQPDINQDDEMTIPAKAVVLTYTGHNWRSSFAVTHWIEIPEEPND